MTTTINASTSSGLVVTPDNSGNVVLQYNGVAAPAFSVYRSGNQTFSSNTWTKIAFNTEEFDTANCFDSTTNYRFTPNVAGYYQFNFNAIAPTASRTSELQVFLYKNGSQYKSGIDITSSSGVVMLGGSATAYANGTTDYFEFYLYTGTGGTITGSQVYTYFQGFLARAA
mgnify:CR=1 FL=1